MKNFKLFALLLSLICFIAVGCTPRLPIYPDSDYFGTMNQSGKMGDTKSSNNPSDIDDDTDDDDDGICTAHENQKGKGHDGNGKSNNGNHNGRNNRS